MYLFVDETECPKYFIVTGLLVNSREDVELAYKRFKKSIKGIPILPELKSKLFTEFKSTEMDRTYQKIKIRMLQCLNGFDHCVIHSCFTKETAIFPQIEKERTYLRMLSRIVSTIDSDVIVLFDRFRKADFEKTIVSEISSIDNVERIEPVESQAENGIQFVDNLCSVIRLHKTGRDDSNFYRLIEKWVKEV